MDSLQYLKKEYPKKFSGTNIAPPTVEEINNIIWSLKRTNSSGHDEESHKIIKTFPVLIREPTSHVYNQSLFAGSFTHLHDQLLNPHRGKGTNKHIKLHLF